MSTLEGTLGDIGIEAESIADSLKRIAEALETIVKLVEDDSPESDYAREVRKKEAQDAAEAVRVELHNHFKEEPKW